MKEVLVICRNCGEIGRYDEKYITTRRKQYENCGMCGNCAKEYKQRKNELNKLIKQFPNWQEGNDLLKENKYNSKWFGIHKGFDYKEV